MASEPQSTYHWDGKARRHPLPRKNDPNEIRYFLEDSACKFDSSHRVLRYQIWERARLYWMDQQWLETDFAYEDATQSPFWKPLEVDTDSFFPLPVQNEFPAPIRNEVARLMGVGSRPYSSLDKRTPKHIKAAKLGVDVLKDFLIKQRWDEKQSEGLFHSVLYGTWILTMGWENDYTKTEPVPVEGAVHCPQCDYSLASPELTREQAEPMLAARSGAVEIRQLESTNPLMPPDERITAKSCPRGCAHELGVPGAPDVTVQAPQPLQPYTPSDDEIESRAKDALGRPLTEEVPIGDVFIRNSNVYDFFPENSGLDVRIGEAKEWAESRIETIDFIRSRYKNGRMVRPEDVTLLMRWHPIVGGSQYVYGGETADPALFDHHARIYEFHKEPWIEYDDETHEPRLNRGRSIVFAGGRQGQGVILLDGDYMIESQTKPGKLMPRKVYEVFQWEHRDREQFGMSASEWMFSAQDSINTRHSQVQYARHIFGTPKILAPTGTNMTYAGFADTGYQSDIYYYDDSAGGEPPQTMQGTQLGQAWVTEENVETESMYRRIGTSETELGQPPPGIDAASALMYVGEKSSETRGPRNARLRGLKGRTYTQILEYMHELYREKRFYTIQDRHGNDVTKAFLGIDLMGQTNIKVKDEAVYDQRLFKRESVKVGLDLGTIRVDTPVAAKKINEILDIPLDVNEEDNLQVTGAESEWDGYLEDGVEPAIDQRLDNDLIHYQTHAISLQSDEAREIKDSLSWNEILLQLWGWEETLDMLEMFEQQLKASPPGPEPEMPQPDPVLGQVTPERVQLAVQRHEMMLQVQAQLAQLPKATELRIMRIWEGMLLQTMPMEDRDQVQRMQEVMKLLRFYAHLEAHYRHARAEAEAATAGMAQPAEPGSAETPSGTQPGVGDVALPAPGAGEGAVTASGAGSAGP